MMNPENIIYLEKNRVYFHAAFLDEKLTIPGIDTYIFIGIEDNSYLFEDAEYRSIRIYFEKDKIKCIYDHKALSKWLLEDHSPKHPTPTEYIYKLK